MSERFGAIAAELRAPFALCAYYMNGGRWGTSIGGFIDRDQKIYEYPVRLRDFEAVELFPGMVATGRVYADLVIDEIEEVDHVG